EGAVDPGRCSQDCFERAREIFRTDQRSPAAAAHRQSSRLHRTVSSGPRVKGTAGSPEAFTRNTGPRGEVAPALARAEGVRVRQWMRRYSSVSRARFSNPDTWSSSHRA